MKFINYLTSIDGVSIYPLISLGIFFLFFVLLSAYVFALKEESIDYDKNLPLEQ